ncbi:hypothetical protein N0V83_009410 [Neocucurbitaria cava]|uniref:Uncharacterized protein n=1 Tax=Neocucurbitaria cava TaxID=798079 RepID=A0A9W8XZQ8_9PLEO|nr:hypothetical protein N0V83_009410 [Neocucurbitaria cava]
MVARCDPRWVEAELIPFLNIAFRPRPRGVWENMIRSAEENIHDIRFPDNFPSTIDSIRLALINPELLLDWEVKTFKRVTPNQSLCISIIVRHALTFGHVPIFSLGTEENPEFPREALRAAIAEANAMNTQDPNITAAVVNVKTGETDVDKTDVSIAEVDNAETDTMKTDDAKIIPVEVVDATTGEVEVDMTDVSNAEADNAEAGPVKTEDAKITVAEGVEAMAGEEVDNTDGSNAVTDNAEACTVNDNNVEAFADVDGPTQRHLLAHGIDAGYSSVGAQKPQGRKKGKGNRRGNRSNGMGARGFGRGTGPVPPQLAYETPQGRPTHVGRSYGGPPGHAAGFVERPNGFYGVQSLQTAEPERTPGYTQSNLPYQQGDHSDTYPHFNGYANGYAMPNAYNVPQVEPFAGYYGMQGYPNSWSVGSAPPGVYQGASDRFEPSHSTVAPNGFQPYVAPPQFGPSSAVVAPNGFQYAAPLQFESSRPAVAPYGFQPSVASLQSQMSPAAVAPNGFQRPVASLQSEASMFQPGTGPHYLQGDAEDLVPTLEGGISRL